MLHVQVEEVMNTEEKLNKTSVRVLVLTTKVLPILIAIIQFLNVVISFFHGNDIPLNYIGGISLLPLLYLYLASYTFKLCEYYRMFLHYSVVVNLINIYDFYFGIPITDMDYLLLMVMLTIITMLVVIYLKFFK